MKMATARKCDAASDKLNVTGICTKFKGNFTHTKLIITYIFIGTNLHFLLPS